MFNLFKNIEFLWCNDIVFLLCNACIAWLTAERQLRKANKYSIRGGLAEHAIKHHRILMTYLGRIRFARLHNPENDIQTKYTDYLDDPQKFIDWTSEYSLLFANSRHYLAQKSSNVFAEVEEYLDCLKSVLENIEVREQMVSDHVKYCSLMQAVRNDIIFFTNKVTNELEALLKIDTVKWIFTSRTLSLQELNKVFSQTKANEIVSKYCHIKTTSDRRVISVIQANKKNNSNHPISCPNGCSVRYLDKYGRCIKCGFNWQK